MKEQFDYIVYLYGYILKLIDTQEDVLRLNEEYTRLIEKGDYSGYEKVLNLSYKMNKNVVDIMQAREVLSAYDNTYTQYTN